MDIAASAGAAMLTPDIVGLVKLWNDWQFTAHGAAIAIAAGDGDDGLGGGRRRLVVTALVASLGLIATDPVDRLRA